MKGLVALTVSSLVGFVFVGALLFGPAGTFAYWQGWAFLIVFIILTTVPNVYLALRRPDVLQRRLRAGPTAESRPAQKFASVGYLGLFVAVAVVSALDHRFGWSTVPTAAVVLGLVLVTVGLGIAMSVILVNSYAAANVAVEPDQQVVSTGMYGIVRHPMYFGVMVMMIGCPLALDSFWGLVVLIPGLVVIAVRILDEEKLLRHELTGYREYTEKVRYRLVPHIW
jgi:protein-S-isoprenylcysteine O-methyltransferase Ste14